MSLRKWYHGQTIEIKTWFWNEILNRFQALIDIAIAMSMFIFMKDKYSVIFISISVFVLCFFVGVVHIFLQKYINSFFKQKKLRMATNTVLPRQMKEDKETKEKVKKMINFVYVSCFLLTISVIILQYLN